VEREVGLVGSDRPVPPVDVDDRRRDRGRALGVAPSPGYPRQPRADPELAARFAPLADALEADLDAIDGELRAVQGHSVDLGGFYRPDPAKADRVMRPSGRFTRALELVATPETARHLGA